MKLSVLSLIILSSLVAAIPAPQRKNGGNRGRPTAAVATPAAATPAAATSAVAAVPAPAVSSKASVAAPAPAVSTKASAAVGTSAGAGAGAAAGGAAGTAAGTAAGGAAGTAAAGTAAAGTAPAGTAPAGTAPAGTAPAGTAAAGSGHLITVNNNCGSGTIKWQRQGVPESVFPGGSTTVSGDITAAILWLDVYNGFACGANALNCGMVEFTLGPNGGFNSINYSLLTEGLGNHKLRAPMQIALAGGTCSAEVPGPCTGDSAAECPTGYTGTDTFSGKPPTCQGTGVGVLITFCP